MAPPVALGPATTCVMVQRSTAASTLASHSLTSTFTHTCPLCPPVTCHCPLLPCVPPTCCYVTTTCSWCVWPPCVARPMLSRELAPARCTLALYSHGTPLYSTVRCTEPRARAARAPWRWFLALQVCQDHWDLPLCLVCGNYGAALQPGPSTATHQNWLGMNAGAGATTRNKLLYTFTIAEKWDGQLNKG